MIGLHESTKCAQIIKVCHDILSASFESIEYGLYIVSEDSVTALLAL